MTALAPDLLEQLGNIPGHRVLGDFTVPDDLDAEFPLPYGDNPPLEWFTTVHHDVIPGATGLITADGRFCAYSHEWDRCHNGYTSAGECWTPPPSVTGNRYFQQSTVVTAEGVQIPVGVIPLGDGHAPIDVDIYQAMAHYDRPERVRVRARAVETEWGCVMCGALVPGTTNRQVGVMRAAALSGDWRWVPELGAMEFLGPCFVARPGLPLGLEHAALAALWDVQRQIETVSAGGRVVAAVSTPVAWSPRAPVADNVPAAVIAAAQQGTNPMPLNKPASASPHPPTSNALPAPPPPDTVAAGGCSCGGHEPARVVAAGPPARARQAAAGSPFSYRELDDQVRAAVSGLFGGDGTGAWVKDWDDAWVVFELEYEDPIAGHVNRDLMAPMSIGADGNVTVDRQSAVEVTTTFVPAPGVDLVPAAQPSPPAEPAVAAHANDSAAIAALAAQVEEQGAALAQIAADMGRLLAEGLPAPEVAEALPAPPETS